MLKKTLFLLLGFSFLSARGEVWAATGQLDLVLSSIPSALVIEAGKPVIRESSTSQIGIRVELIAESQEKLDHFLSSWELRSKDLARNLVEVKIASKVMIARNECETFQTNGTYVRLKGVCVKEVSVYIPRGVNSSLLADGKTIVFNRGSNEVRGDIISTGTLNYLIEDLRAATFKSDKERVFNQFIEREIRRQSKLMSSSQIASIMKSQTFDSDKLAVLNALRTFIADSSPTGLLEIIESLTHTSSKDEARRLLFGSN